MANISRFFWAAATAIILLEFCVGFVLFSKRIFKIYAKYLSNTLNTIWIFFLIIYLFICNKHSKCLALSLLNCLEFVPELNWLRLEFSWYKELSRSRHGFNVDNTFFFNPFNAKLILGNFEFELIIILSAKILLQQIRAANYLTTEGWQVFRANVSESMHTPGSDAST